MLWAMLLRGAAAVLAAIGTACFWLPTGLSDLVRLPVMALAALTAWTSQRFLVKASLREMVCGYVFGSVYALATMLGHEVWLDSDITTLYPSIAILLLKLAGAVGVALLIGSCAALFFHFTACHENRPGRPVRLFSSHAAPLMFMGILLIGWLPWYLALYPGVFSYDIQLQAWQVTHRYYSMGMSPTHTFYWELCIRLGGKTGIEPIVIYSVSQMLMLSAMLSACLTRLARRGVSVKLIVIGLVFLALNPVAALMSFSTTRDVLFSGLFVLMVMDLADITRDPDSFFHHPLRIIAFILGTFFMVTLRSNGMYAMWLGIPAAFLMKKYRIRTAVLLLLPMFLLDGLTLVYRHYGFEEGDGCDTICIPVQQVAAVWNLHKDELPQDEQETILRFLDERKLDDWNPRITDPVKSGLDTHYYLAHTDEFWQLWGELFRRYPDDFISSFLTLNVTAWYPGADAYDPVLMAHYADVLEVYPGLSTYISVHRLFRPDGGYSFEGDSKLPALEKAALKVADWSLFRDIPLVNTLTATSTPLWAAFLCLMLLISRGRWRQILPILPCAGLWATCILGPGIHFRYVLPIYLLYPVLMVMMLQTGSLFGCHADDRNTKELPC